LNQNLLEKLLAGYLVEKKLYKNLIAMR
jgi:hypothetical protein